jgi:hypothetical protein
MVQFVMGTTLTLSGQHNDYILDGRQPPGNGGIELLSHDVSLILERRFLLYPCAFESWTLLCPCERLVLLRAAIFWRFIATEMIRNVLEYADQPEPCHVEVIPRNKRSEMT